MCLTIIVIYPLIVNFVYIVVDFYLFFTVIYSFVIAHYLLLHIIIVHASIMLLVR